MRFSGDCSECLVHVDDIECIEASILYCNFLECILQPQNPWLILHNCICITPRWWWTVPPSTPWRTQWRLSGTRRSPGPRSSTTPAWCWHTCMSSMSSMVTTMSRGFSRWVQTNVARIYQPIILSVSFTTAPSLRWISPTNYFWQQDFSSIGIV